MSGLEMPQETFIEVPESEYYALKSQNSLKNDELWSFRIAKLMLEAVDLINYEGVTVFVEYMGHIKNLIVRIYMCEPKDYHGGETKAVYEKSLYWDGETAKFDYFEIMENLRRCKYEDYEPFEYI